MNQCSFDTTSIQGRRAIFSKFAVRSIRGLRNKLESLGAAPLPQVDQGRIVSVLEFALVDKNAWPETRDLMLLLAPKIEQAGLSDFWLPFLESAVSVSKQCDDVEARAALSLYLGLLHQSNNRWEASESAYKVSIDSARSLQDVPAQSLALSRLAYLQRLRGKSQQAEELAHEALSLLPPDNHALEFAYFVLGTVAEEKREYDSAEQYLIQSLTLCQIKGDTISIAKRKRDLGILLTFATKYREARDHLEESLALFESLDYAFEVAQVKEGLGVICSRIGQPERSLEYYAEALETLLKIQSKRQLAQLYNNQGFSYRLIDCWSEAEAAFRASVVLWEEVGMIVPLINSLDNLGEVYLHNKDREQATATFQRAVALLPRISEHPKFEYFKHMACEHLEEARRL